MGDSSESLRKPRKLLLDSEEAAAAAAAEQLMQLSESDEDNNYSEKGSKRAKIEEIFGKESEMCRPKKRRYRSLDSLYRATKPVPFDVYRRKKLRYY
ncbi:hypothetical protein KPL70_021752 [Citrus sinensis]|uniref:Uncharacterized protein n=2 Tax=Citrus TaxID=2706 RepID=V4S1F8_CITCL|nr:hypothetical protein CICLE_v10027346mg [Citrus x clementina]KAH9669355.1 hypothetical protein KPL70_021752 [Citrus sinensis]GAY60253.1 hypothetical protein CUMW_200510 [Citrus unshiu]